MPAFVPEIEALLTEQVYSPEVACEVRQEVLLSLLAEGRPLDLRSRIREKLKQEWRGRNRFRLVSLDTPVFQGDERVTLGDTLIG